MSHGLAPWDDPSWQKWTCSSLNNFWKFGDRHYEMHNLDIAKRGLGVEYLKFIHDHKCVYIPFKDPERVPNGVEYPIRKALERFGPYHFTSTHAYMLAHAIMEIEALPKEERAGSQIGLFGIDMTAKTEYLAQRPGFQAIYLKGREAGISIEAPFQSDILQPPPLYGYEMFDPFWIKQNARLEYLRSELDAVNKRRDEDNDRSARLTEAFLLTHHNMTIWGGRGQHGMFVDEPEHSGSSDQERSGLPD